MYSRAPVGRRHRPGKRPAGEGADSASAARASEDVAAIWKRVREQLEASVPAIAYKLWLEPLQAVSAAQSTLYLAAPREIRAWVERRYSARIAAVVRDLAPALRSVGFVDAAEEAPSGDEAWAPKPGFDHFVIGESNRFAHAAALAVAEIPGEAYNPLFLHGPPGVGKSHLLAAIAEYLRSRHPGMSVRLTTAEGFTSDFVTAIRRGPGQPFKAGYRDVDALLVDDVQFLEDKAQTGEEFFHTFNALHERGSQIVLSSDTPHRANSRVSPSVFATASSGGCAPRSPSPTARPASPSCAGSRERGALISRGRRRACPARRSPRGARTFASSRGR